MSESANLKWTRNVKLCLRIHRHDSHITCVHRGHHAHLVHQVHIVRMRVRTPWEETHLIIFVPPPQSKLNESSQFRCILRSRRCVCLRGAIVVVVQESCRRLALCRSTLIIPDAHFSNACISHYGPLLFRSSFFFRSLFLVNTKSSSYVCAQTSLANITLNCKSN